MLKVLILHALFEIFGVQVVLQEKEEVRRRKKEEEEGEEEKIEEEKEGVLTFFVFTRSRTKTWISPNRFFCRRVKVSFVLEIIKNHHVNKRPSIG